MRQGLFITFEGGEGAGKSVQSAALTAWLRSEGYDTELTREPGTTWVGAEVRRMLLHSNEMDPRTEALLFAADRAEHVARVIRPRMAEGAIVISDRYADSSVAYQGAGRELGIREITGLSEWASAELAPDLTFLLDIDPAIGRSRRPEALPDRIEGESLEFHHRVRRSFLALAELHRDRYVIVDAEGLRDEITSHITSYTRLWLPSAKGHVSRKVTAT